MGKVAFHYAQGANYLVSDQPLVCFPEPFAGIKVGDRVSGLGRKRRGSWTMKPGYFLQYHGQYNLNGNTYVIFLANGEEVFSNGMYWYYAFAVVLSAKNTLYCQSQFNAGYDITVDEVMLYTEKKEVVSE